MTEHKQKPKLLTVSRIWDFAEHNAFTDLIEFKDHFYCCFRESNEHIGKDGSVRILKSKDAILWQPIALLNKLGYDLRDPKLSIMPNGVLMLTLGGSRYNENKYIGCNPLVAFSKNGMDWSEIEAIEMPEEWIWRLTWHQGVGYGASYRLTNKDSSELNLFKTLDGLQYTHLTKLDVPHYPNETTLRFLSDNRMVALIRRDGPGWIGVSNFPYTTWKWVEIGFRLGGPNFVVLTDDSMWACSRFFKEKEPMTAFGPMTLDSYTPELILPSAGDTSYPGIVYKDNHFYISYYSSHGGKSAIYIAQVSIQ